MKLSLCINTSILAASLLATSAQALEDAKSTPNSNYNYVELSAGEQQLAIKLDGYKDDLRMQHLQAAWSGNITQNIYSTLQYEHIKGEGDRGNGFEIDVDEKQHQLSLLVGYAYPVMSDLDLYAGIGAGQMKTRVKVKKYLNNKLLPLASDNKHVDKTETALAWQAGIKKRINKIVAIELSLDGLKENVRYGLQVPLSINQNVSIKLGVANTIYSNQAFNRHSSQYSVGLRLSY